MTTARICRRVARCMDTSGYGLRATGYICSLSAAAAQSSSISRADQDIMPRSLLFLATEPSHEPDRDMRADHVAPCRRPDAASAVGAEPPTATAGPGTG